MAAGNCGLGVHATGKWCVCVWRVYNVSLGRVRDKHSTSAAKAQHISRGMRGDLVGGAGQGHREPHKSRKGARVKTKDGMSAGFCQWHSYTGTLTQGRTASLQGHLPVALLTQTHHHNNTLSMCACECFLASMFVACASMPVAKRKQAHSYTHPF